jgi:hypothetical protein
MQQILIGAVFKSMSDPFVGGKIDIQKQTDIVFFAGSWHLLVH